MVAPAPDAFSSTRRAEGGGSIGLILAGELDLAARPQLITALDAAQADSDRVVFFGPLGQVRRVLDLVGAPAGLVIRDRDELPSGDSIGAAA